jgi:hypothetical protein
MWLSDLPVPFLILFKSYVSLVIAFLPGRYEVAFCSSCQKNFNFDFRAGARTFFLQNIRTRSGATSSLLKERQRLFQQESIVLA